jgi:aminoglycoside 6'-N-acetyltransferase I
VTSIERCDELRDDWIALRCKLWPHSTEAEHRNEARELLSRPDAPVFLARSAEGAIVGFAEAALRRDCVNGCETSPVVFLEGWYVEPGFQGRGIGRALCAAVERWGADRGCTEFASDSLIDNESAHAAHRAVGFEETERVVYFRKRIDA